LIEVNGITQYDETITSYPPGKYGIIGISDDGSEHTITIRVTVVHPFPEILLTGLVSIGIGCVSILSSIFIRGFHTIKES
jgi:hypothetical protein